MQAQLTRVLRQRSWSILLTAAVLSFLWLPPLAFYGRALWQVLTTQPELLRTALPLDKLPRMLFFNTVYLAFLTAAFALVCGVPAGIAMARGRGWPAGVLGLLVALPLTLPPIMPTFAWLEVSRTPPAALMASYGATQAAVGNPVWRASLLLALCFYPVVSFATFAALRAIPGELEDAARLQGGTREVWMRVLLPLMAPALWGAAGLLAALAMWEMGAPDLLDVRTYSVEIYRNLSAGDNLHESDKFVHAAIKSLPMLLLGALALWPALRALQIYAERSITFTPGSVSDGRKSMWPAGLWVCLPLVLVSPVGPLAVFASELRPPHILLETWQDNGAEIFNTALLATTSAALMTWISFALAACWRNWTARARSRALLLHLLPGFVAPILLGLALIQFYNRPLFAAIYGGLPATGWTGIDWLQDNLARYGLETLAYIARFLPLAVLLAVEAVRRTDPALLEMAQSLGATPRQVNRSILAPLLKPALIGIFILTWTLCSSELSTSILVQQPGGQPLTIPLFQQMHIFNLSAVAALCLTLVGLGAAAFTMAALAMRRWKRS